MPCSATAPPRRKRTNAAFALYHFGFATVALALHTGVGLGVQAWRTGWLRPCIACHLAFNMVWNVHFTRLA